MTTLAGTPCLRKEVTKMLADHGTLTEQQLRFHARCPILLDQESTCVTRSANKMVSRDLDRNVPNTEETKSQGLAISDFLQE